MRRFLLIAALVAVPTFCADVFFAPFTIGTVWIYYDYHNSYSSGRFSGSSFTTEKLIRYEIIDTTIVNDSLNITFKVSDSGMARTRGGDDGGIYQDSSYLLSSRIDSCRGSIAGGTFSCRNFFPFSNLYSVSQESCTMHFDFKDSFYLYDTLWPNEIMTSLWPIRVYDTVFFLQSHGLYYLHRKWDMSASTNFGEENKTYLLSFNGEKTENNPSVELTNVFYSTNPCLISPNPFNSSTSISFSLEHPGQVKLKVFDSRGRVVTTLLNRRMEKGDHKISWRAGGMPPGVYFCRMSAGGFSQVKKLVLLR